MRLSNERASTGTHTTGTPHDTAILLRTHLLFNLRSVDGPTLCILPLAEPRDEIRPAMEIDESQIKNSGRDATLAT